MNKHLFKNSFKVNLKNLLIWTAAAAGTAVLLIFLYPMYRDIFGGDSIPEELANLFPTLDFEIITNYFAFEIGTTLIIIGAMYAAIFGMNILRKEFQDDSGQILYTMPISRTDIIITKLLNLVLNIFIFNAVMTALSLVSMIIVENGVTFNIFYFLEYMTLLLAITLTVGLISFSLTTYFKSRTSIGLNIGLVLLFFIISTVSGISEQVEFLKYFSPFSYLFLDPSIMEDGVVFREIIATLSWLAGSIIISIYSILRFKKTDIL